MLVWYCIGAILSGIPNAWAWGKYLHFVRTHNALRASVWDFIVVILGSVAAITLWDKGGHSPLILLSYALGSAVGTNIVVRHNRKK